MSKFLLNNQKAHSQQSFEGQPTVEDLWTWIKIRANSFIKTLVNNTKQKINEGALNIITRKKNATSHFKEHRTIKDISLVVIRFFFSQTNLVFKYNPLFTDILDSFCHSLFTF